MSNPTGESSGSEPLNSFAWTALASQIPMSEVTLDARADIAAVAMAERARIRLQDRLAAARGREIVIGVTAHGAGQLTRSNGRVVSIHTTGVLLERDEHEYELCIVFWPTIAWIQGLPWALRDESDTTDPAIARFSANWTQLLRAAEHLAVRVQTSAGQSLRGRARLGEDFISIHDEHGVDWTVPLAMAQFIEFQRFAE